VYNVIRCSFRETANTLLIDPHLATYSLNQRRIQSTDFGFAKIWPSERNKNDMTARGIMNS